MISLKVRYRQYKILDASLSLAQYPRFSLSLATAIDANKGELCVLSFDNHTLITAPLINIARQQQHYILTADTRVQLSETCLAASSWRQSRVSNILSDIIADTDVKLIDQLPNQQLQRFSIADKTSAEQALQSLLAALRLYGHHNLSYHFQKDGKLYLGKPSAQLIKLKKNQLYSQRHNELGTYISLPLTLAYSLAYQDTVVLEGKSYTIKNIEHRINSKQKITTLHLIKRAEQ